MTTPTPEAIEAAARAMYVSHGGVVSWENVGQDYWRNLAAAALSAAAPIIEKAARVDELRQQAKLFEIAAGVTGSEFDLRAAEFCNNRAATIEGKNE